MILSRTSQRIVFFWVFFLDELEEEMILDYYLVANHPTLTHEIFVCLKNALVVLV